MEVYKKMKNNIFLILVIFTIILLSIGHLFNVWLVINDDIIAHLNASRLGFIDYMKFGIEAWINQGRPNFIAYISYFIPFAFDNFIYYKIISITTILSNIVLLAALFYQVFKSKWIALICFLLGIVGLQNSWEHNPITSFPGFFSISISILLLSLITFSLYLEKKKKLYLYISLLCYFFTLYTYELFVSYILLFIVLALIEEKNFRNIVEKCKCHLILIFFYLVTYLLFRSLNESLYEGVQLSNNYFTLDVLKVIWQYSISAIPTYFLFNEKYQYLLYIYSDLHEKNLTLSNIIDSLRMVWVLKAILVYAVFVYCALKIKVNKNSKYLLVSIILAIIYFFTPSIPLAITKHYQDTVMNDHLLGMPVSYFSYISLIALSTFILVFLLNLNIRKKVLSKILIFVIALGVSFISIGVDFNNYYISENQALAMYKWKTIDKFIESEDFKNVPNNSYIVAPTLWEQVGSLGIHDSYWDEYFDYKTNHEKNVDIIKDIEDVPLDTLNVYVLKYSQNTHSENQYLLFSKVDRVSNFETSNQVSIYNYTYYDDYTLIGRKMKNDISNIEITGVKIVEAANTFVLTISPSNYSIDNGLKKTIITGDQIQIDTLFINYNNEKFYQ
ncbi:hypothetical protein MKX53_03505 [Psychrobacillus sp. FSL K6-4615]|uniref:hypothetical protein n=1 Tax=Psychrobacillus sp. FSL K6-4615 TaxID=2921551 RepID=UPI0030FB6294